MDEDSSDLASADLLNSLVVIGPDGQRWLCSQVPTDTLIREIGSAILEEYGYASVHNSHGELVSFGVDLVRDDGSYERLRLTDSLFQAGIQTDDCLSVHTVSSAGGPPWVELATYLESAAAAGVIGGAAYDLLKSTLHSIRNRWHRPSASGQVPSLTEDEAVAIARACICQKFAIPDLREITLVSARYDATCAMDMGERWFIAFQGRKLDIPAGMVAVAFIHMPQDGPDQAQVLIAPDSAVLW